LEKNRQPNNRIGDNWKATAARYWLLRTACQS